MATKYSDALNSVVNAGGTTAHALTNAAAYGGKMRVLSGNFEVATTDFDAVGDLIVIARLPASAIIHTLKLGSDDLDSGTALLINIGTYKTNGTAVDADCYAAANDILSDGAAAGSLEDFRWSAITGIETQGDPIWTNGSEDPNPGGVMRDIGLAVSTVATGEQAGTIGYEITYTVE